tara:strand:- start:1485 stop:1760 length:276 start_codon:yes stop_codon:yes gene_type:complete
MDYKHQRSKHTGINSKDSRYLLGVGLDCDDGHKRITQSEKFSIHGGSQNTHDKMTETLIKTFEDLSAKGKALEDTSLDELTDIVNKNTPKD